ncbi:large subunit ribosomal protein L4 [Parelusimicrobium proximum]|uniref:50S ribosomal protein L4 n=1 Tax=Parelusimicrobium proximum TaxID=3228953 RepID=UPI003D167B51
MEIKVLNTNGTEQGTAQAADALFSVKPNPTFLHEIVTAYLANQRSGSASVKTRAEVSGTGKKIWKQKGTGRARHGDARAPIFRHGGVAFGPTPRSFRQYLPVAKRRAGLAQALSAKYAEGNIVVIDSLKLKEPKTKELVAILEKLEAGRKPLILTADYSDTNLFLSARNIENVSLSAASDIHAYGVLNSSKVIITKEALEVLKNTFVKEAK